MKSFRSAAPHLSHRRRGTLFHYYLMYLFLSGVLLTTAGICIHAILKADRLDAQESLHLKTLLRLDRVLREDASNSQLAAMEVTSLELTTAAATQVMWKVEGNMVQRETLSGTERTSVDRFVFRKGTEFQFRRSDNRRRVVLSLLEASPVSNPSADSDSPTAEKGRLVEIQLRFSTPGGSA